MFDCISIILNNFITINNLFLILFFAHKAKKHFIRLSFQKSKQLKPFAKQRAVSQGKYIENLNILQKSQHANCENFRKFAKAHALDINNDFMSTEI